MIYRKLKLLILLTKNYFLIYSFLIGQEIPIEFWDYKVQKINADIGKNWDEHTTLGSFRYRINNKEIEDLSSSKFYSRLGVILSKSNSNDNRSIYNYSRYLYNKNYYSYLYSRIVNNPENFPRYSGIEKDINRLGFNSGETDLAGIGFENNGIILQYGRGRQSIGAGDEINIVLNENSYSYDHILFGLSSKNFRTRYFHGFLENIDNYNRYLTGRCIEWMLKSKFVISFSEIIIYSGENRPMDFAYLNPISSHLEIEFNNRANKLNTDSGNAVWQTSIDWLLNNRIRFSVNYAIDELILDQSQIDSGKVNGMAYSLRLAWTPSIKKYIITYDISMIHVGSHTFSHEDGYNNFVSRNSPLGWFYGSDGDQINVGVKFFNQKNLICEFDIGKIRIGDKSIYYRPYEPYTDYLSGVFPTPKVNSYNYFQLKMDWFARKKVRLDTSLKYEINNDKVTSFFNIGINILHDFSF